MSSNEYGLIEPAHPNASNSARPRDNNFTRNNGESQIAKMIVGTLCLMFIIPLILAFVVSIFLFPKILDKIEDVSENGPTLERNPDEALGAEEHALAAKLYAAVLNPSEVIFSQDDCRSLAAMVNGQVSHGAQHWFSADICAYDSLAVDIRESDNSVSLSILWSSKAARFFFKNDLQDLSSYEFVSYSIEDDSKIVAVPLRLSE